MAPSTAPLRPRQAQSVPIATEPAPLVAERLRRRGPTSTRFPHACRLLTLAPSRGAGLAGASLARALAVCAVSQASIAPAHSSPSLQRAAAHDRRCAGGPLRAAAVEVRRHRRWRQAAESSGVCMRAAGATCEPGSGRPRWRPPEAARDLRPHGVLRRRLVAGEVCRLQALQRVTALLTALLLAPQAGWPCQHKHAVLALPGPRRLDGSFAGRQESGQSAASPALRAHAHTARSHMAYAQLNVSRCHRAYVLSS